MTRRGFSLLEIIIATAVLATSAMVLVSLIGLGAKYGNRAEERAIVLSQAESLMDEFLAQLGNVENQDEQSGTLPGAPQRNYRISAAPFEFGDAARAGGSGESGNERRDGLLRVTVEVFEASSLSVAGNAKSSDARTSDAKPLIALSRLIRRPHDVSDVSASGQDSLQQGDVDAMDLSQRGAVP